MGCYSLPVPGLAEKRPSVIIGEYPCNSESHHVIYLEILGDTIAVKKSGGADDKWFEGHVHYLREAEVGLRFHGSFSKHATRQFDVRFQLNRVPLRRQHQALRTSHHAPHLLFPQATHATVSAATLSTQSISLYDRKIENNPRQLQAIKHILALSPKSAPFIVFGP